MNRNAGIPGRLLFIFLIAFVFVIISGCGTKAILPTYMQPELLYLKEEPYKKLYVEVDIVEGTEVPDAWLDTLKEFLEQNCDKPDGIKIVRDKPVPLDEIKDMPIGPASVFCINGPDPDFDPQCAYLHVFFYNYQGTLKKAGINAHVISSCPNTIFFPTYKFFRKNIASCALQHEAGHVLGLSKELSHSDGAHCKNNNCLMNPSPGLLSELGVFFGIPIKKSLCYDCLNDLANYKSETADPNLTFEGPFLMRKEDGYSVVSLPYCAFIIPQFLEEKFLWPELLESIKSNSRKYDYEQYNKQKNQFWLRGTFTSDNEDNSLVYMDMLRESFTKAAKDPDPMVRDLAVAELKELEQTQQE